MTPLEVLVGARRMIEDPANWAQDDAVSLVRSHGPYCAGIAIEYMTSEEDGMDIEAVDLFASVIGTWPGSESEITTWNDAPERTHADVLAAFDRAIEKARR